VVFGGPPKTSFAHFTFAWQRERKWIDEMFGGPPNMAGRRLHC